jgi:hypothetical protein
LIAAVTAIGFARDSDNASASDDSVGALKGVTAEQLAKGGIKLAPISGTPLITKDRAAEIASSEYDDPVADEAYADCTQFGSGGVTIQHAPCWAVAFTPPKTVEMTLAGPDGDYNRSHGERRQVEVALVNAETGEVMISFAYGAVVPTGGLLQPVEG